MKRSTEFVFGLACIAVCFGVVEYIENNARQSARQSRRDFIDTISQMAMNAEPEPEAEVQSFDIELGDSAEKEVNDA
jgi:cation transport ATPase